MTVPVSHLFEDVQAQVRGQVRNSLSSQVRQGHLGEGLCAERLLLIAF